MTDEPKTFHLSVANENDAQPIGDRLTVAAINALRSYEYGNSSPDLAKEVADKLSKARRTYPESQAARTTTADHIVESDKKVDIEALRRIADAAPRGRWSVWTSNSWRRVFADQRGKHVSVIEPTTQMDGHADLLFGAGVATYLESFPAEVALEVLEELAAARAAHANLFGLLERAHRAIDLLLAQMIMAAPDFRPTRSVIWPDMMAIAAALGRMDGA